MKGHTWGEKKNSCKQLVTQRACQLLVLFLLTVSFFSMKKTEKIGPAIMKKTEKIGPVIFCFSLQTELEWNWYSSQQVTVFEVWNAIPGKQDLEKRECSYAAGGKPHLKSKTKIQIGFNYDSMWLYGVWTKSLKMVDNMWKQISYLRRESKASCQICSWYAQILLEYCMCLFKLLLCLDVWLEVGLLDHMCFWGTATLFSTVTAPIYIPSNSAGGFPFLHTLCNTCYLDIFKWWPFWPVWGSISLKFWYAFL